MFVGNIDKGFCNSCSRDEILRLGLHLLEACPLERLGVESRKTSAPGAFSIGVHFQRRISQIRRRISKSGTGLPNPAGVPPPPPGMPYVRLFVFPYVFFYRMSFRRRFPYDIFLCPFQYVLPVSFPVLFPSYAFHGVFTFRCLLCLM